MISACFLFLGFIIDFSKVDNLNYLFWLSFFEGSYLIFRDTSFT